MTSNIVIDALRMAWFKRHPHKQAGLLFHSDQGSQRHLQRRVQGARHREFHELARHRSVNACSETLFGSLKIERLDGRRFVTRRHAQG